MHGLCKLSLGIREGGGGGWLVRPIGLLASRSVIQSVSQSDRRSHIHTHTQFLKHLLAHPGGFNDLKQDYVSSNRMRHLYTHTHTLFDPSACD